VKENVKLLFKNTDSLSSGQLKTIIRKKEKDFGEMLKQNKLDTYNSNDMSMYNQKKLSTKDKEKLNYEI